MYDVGLLSSLVDLVSVKRSFQPVFSLPCFCFILSLEFAIYFPPGRRILWPRYLQLRFGFRNVSSDERLP